jgi:hypothetical protein
MLFRISFQSSIPVLHSKHNSFPTVFLPDISKQRIGTEGVEAFIIPCSGRQRWLLKIKYVSAQVQFTLISGRKKESLPVFFLPKHCTLGTEAMVDCRGGGSVLSREMEKESLEFPYTVICPSVRVSLSVRR